jgi:uncharacterized membrane protein YhaH (DUF805 family)
MKQGADDAWFYTRGGERIGPVSLSELRIKAGEGALHPRLDMAWTQGMDEWKPAGDIDGLFERKTVVEEVAAAPATPDPYQPPAHQEAAALLAQDGNWPGARRRTFYLMTLVFPFVWNFCCAALGGFFAERAGPELIGVLMVVAMILPVILSIYVGVQRLANTGMSRWWYLGNLVPILNFWVGYRMFVCPAGYAYHKKLDTIGVVLAVIYWLLIALWLLAMIAIVAVFFGLAGNPEIRQQFNDALQEALKQQPAAP